MLKPQRLEEERIRCHLTWQEFDRLMWLAGCADASELEGLVIDPADFVEHRKDVVLGFSDQVPFWAKLVAGKQFFLESELKTSKDKHLEISASSQASQNLPPGVLAEDLGGMTQTRGNQESGADKFRITVELAQVVYKYFDISQKPIGKRGLTLVIFQGCTRGFPILTTTADVLKTRSSSMLARSSFERQAQALEG
jgi:hypothetical protein